VRAFTKGVLIACGSAGGNKNLFINSKLALMKNSVSPMGLHRTSISSAGFSNMQDHGGADDYLTLKKNSDLSRTLARRNSSTL